MQLCNSNSLYSVEDTFIEVKTILKKNLTRVVLWESHGIKSRKMTLLQINKNITGKSIELGKETLHTEAEQNLLGIIIDMDFNFQSLTKSTIKTANQKLSVIS